MNRESLIKQPARAGDSLPVSAARPLAVIADTHGNAAALEAVLDDIRRSGPATIINLGDNANGPLDPARTVSLLRSHEVLHVRGNGDRITAEGGKVGGSTGYAAERLNGEELRWLGSLPTTLVGDGWIACHGSPQSDTGYLLEKVTENGVQLRSASEVASLLSGVDAALILCGHTHVARIVCVGDGRIVVNPGSVGLPAYDDLEPFPHRMETGSPHARYAWIERSGSSWRIELRAIVYGWTQQAQIARERGWTEWARALETGYT